MRESLKNHKNQKTKENIRSICAMNIAKRIYFVYTESKYPELFRTDRRKEPGWEKRTEK